MEEYVRCIKVWDNSSTMGSSVVGKIYDTKIPPKFSCYTWQYLLTEAYQIMFVPATKEEWDLQEGFYVKDILVEDLSYQEDLIRLLKKCNMNKDKFIVGEWYRRLYSENSFIRFSHIENVDNRYNKIFYNENIDDGVFKVSEIGTNYWANSDFEKHALDNPVDLTEIQQYLPNYHEQKFYTGTVDLEPLTNLLKNIK
jgi:hypothetical protein